MGREPISARLIADLFKTAGADRMMAVDLHAGQIQGFFDGPVDHLFALPVLADYVGEGTTRSRLTVVSPDAGRVRVADLWTTGSTPRWRSSTSAATRTWRTRSTVHEVVGEVEGRVCLLVDDMIDTGGTICQAAEALIDARRVGRDRAATHARPVRSGGGPAEELADQRGHRHEHAADLRASRVRQAHGVVDRSADRRAIREVFEDGSVTSLFDGNA